MSLPRKETVHHAIRAIAPVLVSLSFITAAHAPGTMDFSGAQTLMGTFKTFAVYAGAVICFGGLIFAGIRMMSGRFQFTAPNKSLGVANRDLAVIESIEPDSRMVVRLDNNRQVEFDVTEHRHFNHRYAVTSPSSQGAPSVPTLLTAMSKRPKRGMVLSTSFF